MGEIGYFRRKKESLINKYGKGTIITTISVFIITLFLIGTSYSIFTDLDQAEEANTITVGTLNVEFIDNEEGLGEFISLPDSLPISNEAGKSTEPYKFKVTNNGNIEAVVKIAIEYDEAAIEICGCAGRNIDKSNIMYYVVETASGNEIGPNVLEESPYVIETTLDPQEFITYELRTWIKEDTSAGNYSNKHFHGKIVIESGQKIIESVSLIVELNGATTVQNFEATYLEGASITLIEPTLEGYLFKGWEVSGIGASINDNVLTIGSESTTLTAEWAKLATFEIEGTQYQYEEGKTYGEWLSDMCAADGNFSYCGSTTSLVNGAGLPIIYSNTGATVLISDTIVDGTTMQVDISQLP